MRFEALLTDRASSVPAPKAFTRTGTARSAQDLLMMGVNALFALHDRAQERRRLAGLDDRMLHDIGVDRASAAEEADKPFWRH